MVNLEWVEMLQKLQQIQLKELKKILKKEGDFKLNNVFDGPKGGVFDFASSNELEKCVPASPG